MKNPISSSLNLADAGKRLRDGLFIAEGGKVPRGLVWAWLVALYLIGILLWGKFLNWGNIPFDFHDWSEINGPRLAFLQDAVQKGLLPLHMPDKSALSTITDRFMAIPDVILSPQVLLLRFMELGPFILVNLLLLYSLGYLGLLWFRRRFALSPVAFTILFLLFNFSGHITAHISVGHITWGGYFLFPWFVALVLDLIDGDDSWRWVTKISLLMFFTYLQGSFHHFVWELLFLGLLALSARRLFLPALKAAVMAILLSMVRILPTLLLMGQFNTLYHGGYPTLFSLLQSLVTLYTPGQDLYESALIHPLGDWEFDLYTGAVGAAFLLYFGVWCGLRNVGRDTGQRCYPQLLLPAAGLVVLSIGQVYQWVSSLPISALAAERVSARFISLPFVLLMLFAAREFQHWLDAHPRAGWPRLAMLLLLFLLGHDLWQHLKLWQVGVAFKDFAPEQFFQPKWVVSNYDDTLYFIYLKRGVILSLGTLVALLFMAWLNPPSLFSLEQGQAHDAGDTPAQDHR